MSKFIDLTGKKFGRLVVLKKVDNDKWGAHQWLCKCDCGEEKIIRGSSLKSGHTKSCGCLQQEKAAISCRKRTAHGHAGQNRSQIYQSWIGMHRRCTDPNDINYHNYGGRGIKVCDPWMKFENFLEDMGEYPKGTRLIELTIMKDTAKKIVGGLLLKKIVEINETIA